MESGVGGGFLSHRTRPRRGGQEVAGWIPGVQLLLPFAWGNPADLGGSHSLAGRQASLKPKADLGDHGLTFQVKESSPFGIKNRSRLG